MFEPNKNLTSQWQQQRSDLIGFHSLFLTISTRRKRNVNEDNESKKTTTNDSSCFVTPRLVDLTSRRAQQIHLQSCNSNLNIHSSSINNNMRLKNDRVPIFSFKVLSSWSTWYTELDDITLQGIFHAHGKYLERYPSYLVTHILTLELLHSKRQSYKQQTQGNIQFHMWNINGLWIVWHKKDVYLSLTICWMIWIMWQLVVVVVSWSILIAHSANLLLLRLISISLTFLSFNLLREYLQSFHL